MAPEPGLPKIRDPKPPDFETDDNGDPKWSDLKKSLDDPNVNEETKRALLRGIGNPDTTSIRYRGNGDDEEQITKDLEKYRQQHKIPEDAPTPGESLGQTLDKARKEGAIEGDYAQTVSKNKGALEDMKRKAEGGGAGVGNSNELLDQGEPALAFFGRFLPIYKDTRSDLKVNPSGDMNEAFIRRRYDEQRDIAFSKFAADADELRQTAGKQRDHTKAMADKLTGLWHGWSGSASQASQKSFGDLDGAASKVADALDDTAKITTDTTHNVARVVRDKANAVLNAFPNVDTMAGKTSEQIRNIVDVVNGNNDKAKEVCSYFGVETDCGDPPQDLVNKQLNPWVQDQFCRPFEEMFRNFIRICDDAKKGVDDAWKVLTDHLGKIQDNPFANPSGGDQKPGDGNGKHPGGGGQQGGGPGAGGSGGGGAGAGAGGGGAGGGMPGGGGGQPPKMPQPGGPGGGPGGMPGMPGTPQPGAPMPGQPGAPGGQPLQEVSVGDGKDKVTVGEPAPRGHSKETWMGDDGQPKTYDVACQPQGGAGHGGPGQPMPGQPVPGQVAPGTGQIPGQPMPGQVPGQPGPGGTPVQAGPDGKAVIHEGGRTITLERMPDGQMKLGVDNGGGQPPVNQTIGFGHNAPGGGGPGIGATGPYPAPSSPGHAMPGMPSPGFPQQGVGGHDPIGAQPGGPAMTSPQSGGFTSMGGAGANSFGSASGQLFGGPEAGGHPGGPEPAQHGVAPQHGGQPGGQAPHAPAGGAGGLPSMGDPKTASPHGSTGIASMGEHPPPPAAAAPQQGQGQGQGAMGGGMMGGMGAMGGQGQGGGGEQERSNSSPWRTQGNLFDDGIDPSAVRFQSVLGEDKQK